MTKLQNILISKGITPRASEVASLIVQGLSNDQAASHLNVTVKTVKFHLSNVYKILKVPNRVHLLILCTKLLGRD